MQRAAPWRVVPLVIGFAAALALAAPPAKTTSTSSSNQDFKLHASDETHSATAKPAEAKSGATTSKPATKDAPMALSDESFELNYDLAGPYDMRSADPEPTGEIEIKNIVSWSTSKGGDDDHAGYEFEIEWGVAHNHELIFEVPVELGDGRVDGNGDAEIGWHWRLWEEKDWLPAFAMRNFIRMPTGVDSAGVDYEWIGLFTKSLVPGKLRLNVNPFIKSINGNNDEDARHFLWGASAGVDWRVMPDLILVGLYRYSTGEDEGTRDNHEVQLGADWQVSAHQKLGFSTDISLDGDGSGEAFGLMFSYILEFQ